MSAFDEEAPLLVECMHDLVEAGEALDEARGRIAGESFVSLRRRRGEWHASWDDIEGRGGSIYAAFYDLLQLMNAAREEAA